MGIINCTPDSFFENSRKLNEKDILNTIESMLKDGVDMIDIGGASTRPDALIPTIEEELIRITKPIQAIRKEFPKLILSLDTMRSQVAKIGIDNGIDIINDVSGGLYDSELIEVVAKNKVPYILTFNNGNEINRVPLVTERNILSNAITFFSERILTLKNQGINDVIIDPGFGFDKTIEENYKLIQQFELLQILEKPILVGISRKSMIYKKINTEPANSLNGTTVLNTALFLKNTSIFRVHDTKEMNEIRKLLGCSF